jgi:hypothetical protein
MSLTFSLIVVPLASLAFAHLVLGPIAVRLTNRQCANPDFKPCGLGELPGEVSALFNETTGRLLRRVSSRSPACGCRITSRW